MAIQGAYASFAELAARERAGRDYRICHADRATQVVVVAPHGGGIEVGTSELVRGVAAERFSYYCFEGLKSHGNDRLHLTSVNFDEPLARRLVERAATAMALHVCAADGPQIFVGGRDAEWKAASIAALRGAGFQALEDRSHHAGLDAANIVNAGRRGMGLQLEIGDPLRQALFGRIESHVAREPTALFDELVVVLQDLLEQALRQAGRERSEIPAEIPRASSGDE
jgi:phage replication-related protein YjqB (UPF0714/DUF867 family)